jgi:hypothetical protein
MNPPRNPDQLLSFLDNISAIQMTSLLIWMP